MSQPIPHLRLRRLAPIWPGRQLRFDIEIIGHAGYSLKPFNANIVPHYRTTVALLTIRVISERLATATPREVSAPGASEAAVAMVLVPQQAVEVLLIKRAARVGDPWSGQMALPGGRRAPTDVDLVETAMRETLEETGIVLTRDALIGQLDDLHPRSSVLPKIVVRPYVFRLGARPVVRTNHEVSLHLWTPLDTLAGQAGRTEVEVGGSLLAVDAYVLGPHVVWGMTHRIIMPFLNLVNTGHGGVSS
jgi:8-oxo-dGTP pyrophosphatase MutT (NUDIX family)